MIGLSRRAAAARRAAGRHVSRRSVRCRTVARTVLGDLRGISHIVYSALFEKPDLGQGWLDADQISTNFSMLKNLLDSVEPANPDLRHITLLQGAKAYGVHLGQIPVPARERARRAICTRISTGRRRIFCAHDNPCKGWHFTIFRPQVVLGFAPGSAMNMLAAIGAYAAISRARGLPLIYPGIGHRIAEATDVRLLARAIAWGENAPEAANETFNITNGDVFVWQNVFPVIARQFGMEMGLPHPMPLATVMPGHGETWDRLIREHGLAATTLDSLIGSSWQFADFAFSRTHSTASLLSTIKIRQAGFTECIDTEISLAEQLAALQRQKILPM